MQHTAAPRPDPSAPDLHDTLLSPSARAAFFDRVDREGFVVLRGVRSEHVSYRPVRGRSSPGKLSPGEFFHHDGCAGPTKPRVVEIRFPFQDVPRNVATAVAPFPALLAAMVRALPRALRHRPELHALDADELARAPRDEADHVQGLLNRLVRRELPAADARSYFREVERLSGAYVHRWAPGDSLFIANNNPVCTYQHRRSYPEVAFDGRPNGNLVKRWPAEELV